MKKSVVFVIVATLLPPLVPVQAQAQAVPKQLSGRWTIASLGRTNLFSIDDIVVAQDQSFTAKLTWWTIDPKCKLHKEPLTGRLTDTSLTFDATTKCDVSFAAELNRAEKGWVGKATVKSSGLLVDMKAD